MIDFFPFSLIPEHFRKKHAVTFERLSRLLEAIDPHLEKLSDQGMEISYTLPGMPANGADAFYQPRDGVPMIRFKKDGRSAYIWCEPDGRWHVRRWMRLERHQDSQIAGCETLQRALLEIAPKDGPTPAPS